MQSFTSVSRTNLGFTAFCFFLKDPDPAWMVLLERPSLSLRLCHHICTIPALSVPPSEEVSRKSRCFSCHKHIKNISLTPLDHPCLGKAFDALCLFPCVQQWLLKFQYIGWVSLEHYGCCCAFIPRHHYTFKCCISFSTINYLTMVISCNKFHCLVFVLSSDIFPFGVV